MPLNDVVALDIVLPDGSGLDFQPQLMVLSGRDLEGGKRDGIQAVLLNARSGNRDLVETLRRVLASRPHSEEKKR